MRVEHILHVHLAERHAELQQVFRVTTQQRRLSRIELGAQYQPVETVALDAASEYLHEAFFEARRDDISIELPAILMAQVKILDPE